LDVVNSKNELLYSWSFQGNTITNTNLAIDLTITFNTDKQQAIETLTGQTNALYLSFAQHGALPGPAKITTYVGNSYKNGDILYLYYYNEETHNIELISGSGLTVKDGYVEYTITHCSVYFLSQNTPAVYGIGVSLQQPINAPEIAPIVATSDNNIMIIYVISLMLAASMLFIAYQSKKRTVKK